jgi:hypothetical protein
VANARALELQRVGQLEVLQLTAPLPILPVVDMNEDSLYGPFAWQVFKNRNCTLVSSGTRLAMINQASPNLVSYQHKRQPDLDLTNLRFKHFQHTPIQYRAHSPVLYDKIGMNFALDSIKQHYGQWHDNQNPQQRAQYDKDAERVMALLAECYPRSYAFPLRHLHKDTSTLTKGNY